MVGCCARKPSGQVTAAPPSDEILLFHRHWITSSARAYPNPLYYARAYPGLSLGLNIPLR
jgi:hypothetical protein